MAINNTIHSFDRNKTELLKKFIVTALSQCKLHHYIHSWNHMTGIVQSF